MKGETTLRDALVAWLEWRRKAGPIDEAAVPQLYNLLRGTLGPEERERILERLVEQGTGVQDLNEMAISYRDARVAFQGWDLALPKAAAMPAEGPGRITSEGGKYTIEIRPHVARADLGLVVVRVMPGHREALEGKVLILKDSSGRVLLTGKVVEGEVSQEIDGLSRIEYGFVVQTVAEAG